MRRDLIDKFLISHISLFKGKVIDIGGKKIGSRGKFKPPHHQVESWEFLNIDKETNPDYLCDATSIPVKDEFFDTIIATEILEYISDPIKFLDEAKRVLKKSGTIIITTPFMHAVHADLKYDRYRFTGNYLEEICNRFEFNSVTIEPMGSMGSVIYDIIRVGCTYASFKTYKIIPKILPYLKFIFKAIDKKTISQKKYINTGYFIIIKNES